MVLPFLFYSMAWGLLDVLVILLLSSCSAEATMVWDTVLTLVVMKENLKGENGSGERKKRKGERDKRRKERKKEEMTYLHRN